MTSGFAVSAGILLTLVLQTWFEYLQGDFWVNALVSGMSVLATSAFIVGCTSLLGPRGIIGQYMVPGASNALIRSTSYFPDADATRQWWVLGAWIAFGIALALVGHYRDRATVRVSATTLE